MVVLSGSDAGVADMRWDWGWDRDVLGRGRDSYDLSLEV